VKQISVCAGGRGSLKRVSVSLSDVENVVDPMQSVKPGLLSTSTTTTTTDDVCLPLRSVHVRAKLVDLAAQVS